MKIKEKIISEIKKVYDPEIPVNIYDLGLIYNINIKKVRVIFKTEDKNELGNLIKDTRKRVENGNLFVEP